MGNEITRDWIGDTNSVMRSLGANGSEPRAERDYYATDPKAAEWLLRIEDIPKDRPVWECACGELHLSDVFSNHGYDVVSTDIVARVQGVAEYDFLQPVNDGRFGRARCTIITNPPYRYAMEFVRRALEWVAEGERVCMFLRLQFLEGRERGEFYREFPPRRVWVSSSRIKCAKNADFEHMTGSAMCFAWFVWERGYKGRTEVGWFN
ncbi:MAG: hypothetical protein LUD72_01465 [Bacteroidales bacterium]|nr:hypothetical protein [Bacteroidales bacterium]